MRGDSVRSAGKHRSETSEETWDFRDLGLQRACGDCFLRGHIALHKVAAVLVQVGSMCVQQAVGEWPQRPCGTLEFQDSLLRSWARSRDCTSQEPLLSQNPRYALF